MSHASGFDPGLTARWREAVEAHKAHAVAEWPREACGLVLADGAYRPCRNGAETPETAFAIDPDEWLAAGGPPAAVLHSHPAGLHPVTGAAIPVQEGPSARDMRAQADTAVPWGITVAGEGGATDPVWFGDQVPRAPLIGRRFVHGVHDCYALARDWHREAGIPLPDVPRDPDWWLTGQSLYDGFAAAGFQRVHRPEGRPLPGDCFLCAVRAPVMNHGGIYLGDGLILHHLAHRLSGRAPAAPWRAKMTFLLRHRDLPEPA